MSWESFLFTGDDGEQYVHLRRLSFATGISREHLGAYLHGDLYPPDAHIEALAELLGASALPHFLGHQPHQVPAVVAPWGRPPEGTRVLPYIAASLAQPGDFLAYAPVGGRGAHWVEIESIRPEQSRPGNLVLTFDGGYAVEVGQERPLRIARIHSAPDLEGTADDRSDRGTG